MTRGTAGATLVAAVAAAALGLGVPAPIASAASVPTATSTVVEVSSSANPSAVGEDVRLTATVTADGQPVTSGRIGFQSNFPSSLSRVVPVDANGQASIVIPANRLPATIHAISVSYASTSGNSNSGVLYWQVVLDRRPAAVVVTSSPNPSQPGEAVTFTARVTAGGAPVTAGTVTFSDSVRGVPLGEAVAVDANGQASLAIPFPDAGTYLIHAGYSGTPQFTIGAAVHSQAVSTPTTTLPTTTTSVVTTSVVSSSEPPVTVAPSVTSAPPSVAPCVASTTSTTPPTVLDSTTELTTTVTSVADPIDSQPATTGVTSEPDPIDSQPATTAVTRESETSPPSSQAEGPPSTIEDSPTTNQATASSDAPVGLRTDSRPVVICELPEPTATTSAASSTTDPPTTDPPTTDPLVAPPGEPPVAGSLPGPPPGNAGGGAGNPSAGILPATGGDATSILTVFGLACVAAGCGLAAFAKRRHC